MVLQKILLASIVVLVALGCIGCGEKKQGEAKKIKIGLLMETYNIDRWQRDEESFTKKAKELGAEVLRAVADGDPTPSVARRKHRTAAQGNP